MTAAPDEQFVTLARIVKPRGNRGEVAAQDFCEDPDRFSPGADLRLRFPDGRIETRRVENSWLHQGRLVLKFEGVDTISAAEQLRLCEIEIPYEELGPPPEGQHYYVDLVGCTVIDAASGRRIGVVEGLQEPGGQLLLEVLEGERETLIPFCPQICVDVDTQAKVIRADLPEGLEDLNS